MWAFPIFGPQATKSGFLPAIKNTVSPTPLTISFDFRIANARGRRLKHCGSHLDAGWQPKEASIIYRAVSAGLGLIV
jgi:hypothetical protein